MDDEDEQSLLTDEQKEAYTYWLACYNAAAQLLAHLEMVRDNVGDDRHTAVISVLQEMQSDFMMSCVMMGARARRDFRKSKEAFEALLSKPLPGRKDV